MFKQKRSVLIIAFILITAAGMVYNLFFRGHFSNGSGLTILRNEESEPSDSEPSVNAAPEKISVYICGEVNEPGVYELDKGSILNDAIILAGGLTDDAASEHIDLVYILNKNISIRIPSADEIGDESGFVISSSDAAKPGEKDSGLININRADREELMTLPGIGSSTADKIIEYRNKQQFSSIEDIMNVSGIGEGKFNKLKDLICVD